MTLTRARAALAAAALCAIAACDRTPAGMIPDRVACDSCRIEITPELTIGDTAGPSILTGRPGTVVTNGKGKYWIGVLDAFPLLFDSATGTLDEFAREGQGPGEFRHPWVVAHLPGDSLLVQDWRVWHVLAPDMSSARTIAHADELLGFRILDWPRRVVAISHPYRNIARQIHTRVVVATYDMSGTNVVPLDTLYATPFAHGRDAVDYANSIRHTADNFDDRGVWISNYNSYRIVLYSPAGEPQDSVLRRPQWFPGGEPLHFGGPDKPTTPVLTNHWIDDEGRMWVLLSQPRTDTKDAWKDVQMGAGGGAGEMRVSALPAPYELNRTVIEVIDLQQKRVIARHTFDGYITAVLPDNRVASYVETESGVPVLTIHRLRLR